ncbi:hypothetical protein Tco_1189774 [Tanacetum coccineum]
MRYRVSKKENWNGEKWLNVSMSGPAVQQLWTLFPRKQTANLMTNTQTPPSASTLVIPTGAPATNTVANHAERSEKFNGQNFKRWQQKMFLWDFLRLIMQNTATRLALKSGGGGFSMDGLATRSRSVYRFVLKESSRLSSSQSPDSRFFALDTDKHQSNNTNTNAEAPVTSRSPDSTSMDRDKK